MAHINFQGTPTDGRIGGVSYYISSIVGLIARIATNLVPKDRKSSEAQRLTQMALANWVILWRMFAKRLEPTFATRPKGETACNAFVSDNWKQLRVFLTKDMVHSGASVAVPCLINSGTLTPSVRYWKDSADQWMVTDLLLGDLAIDADTTVGQFSRAVKSLNKAAYPDYKSGVVKDNYIDFFCLRQTINIDTNQPNAQVVGRSLKLDTKSDRKLWEATGGSEGFQNFKGHLATPYSDLCFYAWIRLERGPDDEYTSTTQKMVGDNSAMISQYITEDAFLDACKTYGGFTKKFLIPYFAELKPYVTSLPTETTEAGQNPGQDSSQGGTAPAPVARVTVSVVITGENASRGSVSPQSVTVDRGSQVTFTATADTGYKPKWPDNSNALTYTVTANESHNIALQFIADGGLSVKEGEEE